MRKINIANDARRDAEVAFGTTGHKEKIVYRTATGGTGRNERRLKSTMPTTDAALLEAYGDALADALVAGDFAGLVGVPFTKGAPYARAACRAWWKRQERSPHSPILRVTSTTLAVLRQISAILPATNN